MGTTGGVDMSQLQGIMDQSIKDMMALQEMNIKYQDNISKIQTTLGQVAARAAKQVAQG